ncbi:hypothetical protein ABZ468_28375 [Streptomyces sp. NPDC005708]|uniref:hypothetical protein n=1 Tax=Streptomyces sp. NPDC005708 TaxID=3154564 RepID=UPI0033F1EC48
MASGLTCCFTNRATVDYFHFEDECTMLVAFALACLQNRPLSTDDGWEPGGPLHAVRTCLVHAFKHAMEDGPIPPLARVAGRYFGPDLVRGATRG